MTEDGIRVFRPFRAFNGAHVPSVILSSREISPGAKLLWGVLAKYAGEHGDAYPRQSRLAEDLGWNIKTLRKRLEELVQKGYIVQSREKGDRRAHRPFTYRFVWRDEFEPHLMRPLAQVQRALLPAPEDGHRIENHTGGSPVEDHRGGSPIENHRGGTPIENHTGGSREMVPALPLTLENHTGGSDHVHTGGSRINRKKENQLRELEQTPLTPLLGEPPVEDDWPGFPFEQIREAYNSVAKVEGWVVMRKREKPARGKKDPKVIRELRGQWKRHKSSVCEVLDASGIEWFERYLQACVGYVTWDWRPHLEYFARQDIEEAILDLRNSPSQLSHGSGNIGEHYQSLMNAADRVTEIQGRDNG